MKKSFKEFLYLSFSVSVIVLTISFSISGQSPGKLKVRYVDYFYENGSPLNWSIQGDTALKVSLLPDHERDSPNNQTDHWNFGIYSEVGTRVRLIISKMQPGAYNGVPVTSWWNFSHPISCYISYDQRKWQPVATTTLPGNELLVDFVMAKDYAYIARLPSYTVSDLDHLESRYKGNRLFNVIQIGYTLEKRPLEIIRLGNPESPNKVLIRARAHPWEPGGNWIVEGLINKFIRSHLQEWEKTFCVYIMPMANKDGVARGMTRFNIAGMDLNRKWDKMSDPELCPEKYALEKFVEGLLKKGIKLSLAIDIHNDDAGGIELATHRKNDTLFTGNMHIMERLLREKTLFSEEFKYSGERSDQAQEFALFEDGMYSRYGIPGFVWELNANWIGKPGKMPEIEDWTRSGENLNEVFYEYFIAINR